MRSIKIKNCAFPKPDEVVILISDYL